jgi:hypothetical protein
MTIRSGGRRALILPGILILVFLLLAPPLLMNTGWGAGDSLDNEFSALSGRLQAEENSRPIVPVTRSHAISGLSIRLDPATLAGYCKGTRYSIIREYFAEIALRDERLESNARAGTAEESAASAFLAPAKEPGAALARELSPALSTTNL